MKKGFTLIEMVAVLLILALLSAAFVAGVDKAYRRAWRAQARETCRQLCQAWNAYLVDEHKFPEELGAATAVKAEYDNIKYLADAKFSRRGRVYLELTESEGADGLKDHWGQLLSFSLDADYDGVVKNPHPEAFADKDGDTDRFEQIRATSISWSEGDPNHRDRADNPIVIW